MENEALNTTATSDDTGLSSHWPWSMPAAAE